ncbi:MAG TPA: GTPase HflX [Vicinamibacterales bacterium]|nr:GTPase HflX [Vicinamibacterales bacterium]
MKVRGSVTNQPPVERAALVGVITRRNRATDPDQQLDELAGLAEAAGAIVTLRLVQERPSLDPATVIGKGKVEQLKRGCDETGATLIIFDHELTPGQARNLEQACGRRVVDRTELILDIFARRARTREGQLQVELAQLEYALPRLAGSSEALSRLGGGIGTRGPGETKLETDRRRIRHRISMLKSEIAAVGNRRGHLRARRKRIDVPTVALVGYTNAGKTTLFNQLTGAQAVASNALFVTLDPLARRMKLPDARQILLFDTVGFIDRLPHQLVAAFRATLEEVAAADLLVHVIDAAADLQDQRTAAVSAVLSEVGAAELPTIEVFNKIDRLSGRELERLRALHPSGLFVSATKTGARSAVATAIATALAMDSERIHLALDASDERDRRLLADLYRHARVISHIAGDEGIAVEADVPRRIAPRFRRARVKRVGPLSSSGRL